MAADERERGNTMKAGRKWVKRIVWIVILLVVIASAVFLLMNRSKQTFDTEIVRTRSIETFYTFTGNIEPDKISEITASSDGKINRLYVQEGDIVEKNESVLRLQSGVTLEAPIAGTVTDIFFEKDDAYRAGNVLFRVATYESPIVKISIDEYDVDALSVGEEVSVYIQAMDKYVHGTITEISNEAAVTSNVAYYSAKISVEQDGTIKMGMTCEVSAPRDHAYDVTTLPLTAIQFDSENQPYVFINNRQGTPDAVYIALGVSNGSVVEITEGLKVGEEVLIPKSNSPMFMQMSNMRVR